LYFLRIIIIIIPLFLTFSSSYQLHVVAWLALIHGETVLALTLLGIAQLTLTLRGVVGTNTS